MKSRFCFSTFWLMFILSMVFALVCLPGDLRAEDAPAAGGGVTVTTEAPVQPQSPGQPGAAAGEKNPARKEEEDEAAQKATTLDRIRAAFRGKQDLANDLAAARGEADRLKERVAALEKELAAVQTERDQLRSDWEAMEKAALEMTPTAEVPEKPQTAAAEAVQTAVNQKVAAELRNIGHKPAEKPKAAEAGSPETPVNRVNPVAVAAAYWDMRMPKN